MSASEITLFDLPSKGTCWTWNSNPWKTRLALNYKGVPYETEWVEYPDIKPRLLEHFPTTTPFYSIPTVCMPNGKWIMDSVKIAEELERRHPEPSLHMDSAYHGKLKDMMPRIMAALRGVYTPLIPQRLLTERSIPYWNETREKFLGMPLAQLAREHGGEGAWKAATPLLQEVTGWLKDNGEGPFFRGKTVSYADFVWAAFLLFLGRLGADVYEDFMTASGGRETHAKLMEAVAPWAELDLAGDDGDKKWPSIIA
ncbi:Uu.00g133210.m01.CDS01 [Anthostomella pinea]|uniref:Uu.00g133210.m01.CDS01 n=1 Tax=Anthostomella pinea TaxID=933095 RepID=A0AAI8VSX2_9PEZI|nr:Uu.00g133210.m01.CDS01 [Anthostomella pinea]